MSLVTLAELRTYLGVQDSADTPILEATAARASSMVEGVLGRVFASGRLAETHIVNSNRRFNLTRWPVSSVEWVGVGNTSALQIEGDDTDVLSSVQVTDSGVTLTRITSAGTRTESVITSGETMAQMATAISAVIGFTATALVDASWRTLNRQGPFIVNNFIGVLTASTQAAAFVCVDYDAGIVEIDAGWWHECGEACCHDRRLTVRAVYTGGYATIPADIKQTTLETAAQIYRGRRYDTGKTTGDYRTIGTQEDLVEGIRSSLAHRLEVR